MITIVEAIVRCLAARRLRRQPAAKRRRFAAKAVAETKRVQEARTEAERIGDRLELARKLLTLAKAFVKTPSGRWAVATYGGWWLVADLSVDAHGAIWRAGEHHGFGSVPAQRMDAPEVLAARIATKDLALAVERLDHGNIWWKALEKELLDRLWPRWL